MLMTPGFRFVARPTLCYNRTGHANALVLSRTPSIPPSSEIPLSSMVTIRRFRWEDLPQWTDLFNEINGFAGSERAWDVELIRQFLSLPACEPEENCFVAESDGSLVGFALIAPELPIGRAVASGGVVDSHRGRRIGRSLVEVAVQHARALGALVLHVQAPPDSAAARHLLGSSGFRAVRTYSVMRWEGEEVPAPELPPGFGLRSLRAAQDEGSLTRLQNAAFGGSWGFCPNTVDEIEARLNLNTSDPEGVIFVTNRDRLVAYIWTTRTAGSGNPIGCIGMTGVHPDCRGKGLGRAIVLAGLKYLVSNGIRTVELEVDEQNARAKEMYLSLGFRKVREALWYEKALN